MSETFLAETLEETHTPDGGGGVFYGLVEDGRVVLEREFAPPPASLPEESTTSAGDTTLVLGPVRRRTFTAGPARGKVEQLLSRLAALVDDCGGTEAGSSEEMTLVGAPEGEGS